VSNSRLQRLGSCQSTPSRWHQQRPEQGVEAVIGTGSRQLQQLAQRRPGLFSRASR
jgi:hypothetical protein